VHITGDPVDADDVDLLEVLARYGLTIED